AAVVPVEVEAEAQRAQREHGQVEAAAVPGDDVRAARVHEVGEVGHHARLVLVLAERADLLHAEVLAEPHHADDDRAARVEGREGPLHAGGRFGRRVELRVGDRLDVEDEERLGTRHERILTRALCYNRAMSSTTGRRSSRLLAAAAVLLAALAGCAHRPPPVRPWEREALAKRGMRLDMPGEIEEDQFRQHWLGSREGSDYGFGEPGGGCGCN